MRDELNRAFVGFNKKSYRIKPLEIRIHLDTPRGLNKVIWRIYGDEACISSSIVKYIEYQYCDLPKPIKS